MYARLFLRVVFSLILFQSFAQAIPNMFNIQGRLSDKEGNPITSPTEVEIRLYQGGAPNVADEGTVVYKEKIVVVPGAEGIYSHLVGNGVPIESHTLTDEDFDTNDPVYLQISMAGFTLLPRLQIVPHPFSLIASVSKRAGLDSVSTASIQDGAITTEKINRDAVTTAEVVNGTIQQEDLHPSLISGKLIPVGMISMFSSVCPDGWTRFSSLDNRFLRGSDTPGQLGGSDQHQHAISADGTHNHTGVTGDVNRTATRVGGPDPNAPHDEYLEDVGISNSKRFGKHNHPIAVGGSHNHGSATGSINSLPPYYTLVFCSKD